MDTKQVTANIDRFSGYAERYDTYRPKPPGVLPALLMQVARVQRPCLVVDLGSGTGLSTFIWAEKAEEVVGVEPNADMRAYASRCALDLPRTARIRFENAVSSDTHLPDACADIVTCSQSLHWMEPQSTFAEVARILRPGGCFAAYDCDWPPTMHWEAEMAFDALFSRAERLGGERGYYRDVVKWDKEQHLGRMKASGHFRFVREILLHNVESGNAERLVGIALSQGNIATLIKSGVTAEEIGVDDLRRIAERTIGCDPIAWYFSYRVRLGVR
ncbi:MAG TPA: class I SAM-dependent methyltransferase [Acidobacteriota bacterium]|nr:class I SAM-dependent methyltransferase [Acidobacteriota bacterium]